MSGLDNRMGGPMGTASTGSTMEAGAAKTRHHRSPLLTRSAETAGTGDVSCMAAGIVASSDVGSAAQAAHVVIAGDDRSTRYPGGKSLAGVHQWIIGLLPAHVFYAEPFAGHGGIFRHKPPALRSYLIDCDLAVYAWWLRRNDPGTIVHHGDGIRWLELAAEWATPDTLIYCDPPYLLSTRTKKRLYARELSCREHRQILRAVRECQCPVAISGYPSPRYALELGEWYRFEREVITRGGVLRTEVLWTNYDPGTVSPGVAMEYSGLGKTFRERERVSRKIKRWVERIRGLHRHERRALLLAILDAERSARVSAESAMTLAVSSRMAVRSSSSD